MTNWLVLIVFGIAFPLLLFWLALPLVWHALRTAELKARGRSYFRAQQPRRYWAGIVFWIMMLALSLYPAAGAVFRF